jgi:hypothetical protein
MGSRSHADDGRQITTMPRAKLGKRIGRSVDEDILGTVLERICVATRGRVF